MTIKYLKLDFISFGPKILFGSVVLLVIISCSNKPKPIQDDAVASKRVLAVGHIVPQSEIESPSFMDLNLAKVNSQKIGKPKIVSTNKNIQKMGHPKILPYNQYEAISRGSSDASSPAKREAIANLIKAGKPEVVSAQEMGNKDQNFGNFSFFGKLQGLNILNIRCMFEDSAGNLWFGTDGGASRYDGKSFTHFTQKQGMVNDMIYAITEDEIGNIWFGTARGACKFDGKNLTNYTGKEGLTDNQILSILRDKDGDMWFGSFGNGIFRLKDNYFENFTAANGLTSDNTLSMKEDKSGKLWIGTTMGISIYDGTKFMPITIKEGMPNQYIFSIMEDSKGNMWFGTKSGAVRFDGKMFLNYTVTEGLSSNDVSTIVEDNSGNLWFGSFENGVCRFDGQNITRFTESEGLSNNRIYSIIEDQSGKLWFGTYGGGVNRYDGKYFTHYTKQEGLSNNIIFSILEDTSGNIWFGTDGGGVNKYDGSTFTNYNEQTGLDNELVISMAQDKKGNIWFGTNGSVTKFDGNYMTSYSSRNGLNIGTVYSIIEDDDGTMWFASNNGVYRFDGHRFSRYDIKNGLSNNQVYAMIKDKQNRLWFGTFGGGVTMYDHQNFTHFNTSGGLIGDDVYSILQDSSNNIWFGTKSGACMYDGATFLYFTEDDGLCNNSVFGMLEDSNKNIWFGTSNGLSKLTPDKLSIYKEKVLNHSIESGEFFFTNYTYSDGLLGVGCNGNLALKETKDGTIWIGTDDRLTAFHHRDISVDVTPPNIQLSSIDLYNEDIDWVRLQQKKDSSFSLGNGIVVEDFEFEDLSKWYNLPMNLSLAYNNNFLTFNFVGITHYQPSKVRYQFMLEGLEERWSNISDRSSVPYGNLNPGHYTFKVKAMNVQGFWSDEFRFSFTIRPPWWRTWWAYLIYACVLIFILNRIYQSQKQKVIRVEKEISQKRELEQSKEIEKAYTILQSTQTQLIHSEKMASLGELTAGIAHEIQNPLNFVTNFSEVSSELLDEMKLEIEKGNFSSIMEIVDDVQSNLSKINHHGKRADAIVRGMLQHSRKSSGEKEKINLNALCNEFLKLSFHGLRTKDKAFNASFETDFDESIGKVNVIPQDIGRVILNIVNNAFYAVNECAKEKAVALENNIQISEEAPYRPMVRITTALTTMPKEIRGMKVQAVEIKISDNGNGIPDDIKEKIFQPFFTTKPTGEGTGLGLSLAYDIITKGHGGEMTVESIVGLGTTFIMRIPIN